MNVSIYSASTGRIDRLCSAPENIISAQLHSGESYLPGWFACDEYYVANGQAVAMPPKPSEFHEFDYTTKQWFDPRTDETQWAVVRAERNRLLAESDWTQLPDVPLATKTAWAEYRQLLRDITLQPDPFNIMWPDKPL
jgi:hypothetical protein